MAGAAGARLFGMKPLPCPHTRARPLLALLLTAASTLVVAAQTFDLAAELRRTHEAGGGRVVVPPGRHTAASVRVYSHTELHLAAGATIVASPDSADYDPAHPYLLWGDRLRDFSLTGPGTIDGSGHAFFDTTTVGTWGVPGFRPERLLRFSGRRLVFEDFAVVNSSAHVLYIADSRYVRISGLHIANDFRSPNTDGIDISGTSDVTISDCHISTGDDAICLKSGRGPVERVVVTNCLLESDDAAFKLGTGSATVTRDIRVSNCVIRRARYGLALFMTQGGVYENIAFDNLSIRTGSRHYSEYAVYADTQPRSDAYGYGTIRDVRFSDVAIYTAGNLLLSGHPSRPLSGIGFRDVDVYVEAPVDLTRRRSKPRGNKAYGGDGVDGVDYSRTSGVLVLGHAGDTATEGVRIHGDVGGRERVVRID